MSPIIRHHPIPQLTPEQETARARLAAEMRAEREAFDAEVVATIRCPRCKAQPGEPCVWRARHSDPIHAARRSVLSRKQYRTRRGEPAD